jgi:two-component system phosphate regulon sensor histidine kinase PhoR
MHRRLRLIFALLASCLLGSYGLQAYWLVGSYQVATAQFTRTAAAALEAVLQRRQLGRVTKTFNIRFNDYASPHDPPGQPRYWHIERVDTGLTPAQARRPWPAATDSAPRYLRGPAARPPLPPSPAQLIAFARLERARAAHTDSLAHQLSTFVINDWAHRQPVNLTVLARAYQAELSQRHAAQPFRLDTVSRQGVSPTAASQAGYPLHTPALELNPIRGPWVVASFQPPTVYVLRGMAGSLAGSLALLLLTTGCLGLMLHTILGQKKLAEVKNDFIHNMTHELKTPLATVSAAVEALQDFGALRDPQRTDDYLTIARQETARLAALVDRVLRLAVEEHQGQLLTLNPEPVRPAELVAAAVLRQQQRCSKPVQVELAIAPTETLLLDRLHFSGVLDNLLDNAVKYSSAQGVRIRITSRALADGWQLTVADNGLGIAPDYQAAVFEQFFRVPTGNLHPVKGFGLGLFYARQVLVSHEGRLHLRSELGHGSEFILWLPAARQLIFPAEA